MRIALFDVFNVVRTKDFKLMSAFEIALDHFPNVCGFALVTGESQQDW